MRPDQVAAWLSDGRFQAYKEACDGDHDRAVALYNWNAEISAAFMEVLYHLEVLLRNAVDRRFLQSDPDQCLTVCRPEVWLCDPDVLTDESRERVNDAICRLERQGKPSTRGRVIASLSLGFWSALFNKPYENLWRETLSSAFPHGSGKRREIARLVGPLVHFRNRIAHHEAIFSSDLAEQQERHLALAGLIDSEARSYIAALSRVEKLLLEQP